MTTPSLSSLAARRIPLQTIFSQGLADPQAPLAPQIRTEIQNRLNLSNYFQEGLLNQDLDTNTLEQVFQNLDLTDVLIAHLDANFSQNQGQFPINAIVGSVPHNNQTYLEAVTEKLLLLRGYSVTTGVEVDAAINIAYNSFRKVVLRVLNNPGIFLQVIHGNLGFAWDFHNGKYHLFTSIESRKKLLVLDSMEELFQAIIKEFNRILRYRFTMYGVMTVPIQLDALEIDILGYISCTYQDDQGLRNIWQTRRRIQITQVLAFVPDFLTPGTTLAVIGDYLYCYNRSTILYFNQENGNLVLNSLINNARRWVWV